MKTSRVFLCHNSREKDAIKALALRLLSEGAVRTWLDTWEIPGGVDWEKHIRREFAASWSCLVFLGSSGLGPFQRIEIEWAKERQAIDPDYRLIPIVLPGVDEATLPELEALLPGVQRVTLVEDLSAIFAALRGNAPGPPVQTLSVAVAAERWDQTGRRDRSLLIRGQALREAQRVALSLGAFDDLSLSFLASSAEAAQKRLRLTVAVLATATALFAAIAWYADNRRQAAVVAETKATASEQDAKAQRDVAIKQTHLAEQRLKVATSQAKAADARREATTQELYAAIVHSLDAYRIEPTLEARIALIESLTRAAEIKRYYLCPSGEKGTGVTFSPDGATFAFTCGLRDTTVNMVEAGGTLLFSERVSGDGRALAFLDSTTIAIGGSNDLRIISSSHKRVQTFVGHHATISTVASAPQRELIFTADSTGEVRVWRRAGPLRLWLSQVLRNPTPRILTKLRWRERVGLQVDDIGGVRNQSEIFPLDGGASDASRPNILVADDDLSSSPSCGTKYPAAIRSTTNGTAADKRVFAYNTESNEIIIDDQQSCVPLYGHTHNFVLAFRPDGNSLVSVGAVANGDAVHGAILWDLRQVHPLAQLLRSSKSRYAYNTDLTLSHDGSSWACVNCEDHILWDGQPLIWLDPTSAQSSNSLPNFVALSQDGSRLAIATRDGKLAIATRRNGRLDLRPVHSAFSSVRRIWFAGQALYTVNADGAVGRWSENKWSASPGGLPGKSRECRDLFEVGPYLALEQTTNATRSVISFHNLEVANSQPLVVPVPKDAGSCSSLAFAGTSNIGVRLTDDHKPIYIFTVSSKVDLTVWDNPIHYGSGLQTSLSSARISDDGTLLLAMSHGDGASLAMFDLGSRRLIGDVPVPGLRSLAISGDGRRAITFSDVGILMWTLDPDDWANKALGLAGSPK